MQVLRDWCVSAEKPRKNKSKTTRAKSKKPVQFYIEEEKKARWQDVAERTTGGSLTRLIEDAVDKAVMQFESDYLHKLGIGLGRLEKLATEKKPDRR
jgi:hypothetical protein